MRTVEGRARQTHMQDKRALIQEMAKYEQMRNQAGSTLQKGKKNSDLAMNGRAGEHFRFVSQKEDVGVEHNVTSGLGSDAPSSCMDIDARELKS